MENSALQTVPFLFNHNKEQRLSLKLNTDWLVSQPKLPFLVQALPAHTLYSIMNQTDLSEHLEIVEWIRGTQLKKVLDFDVWEFDTSLQTEDISINSILSWIQAWLFIGKSFAAERFFELDEETGFLILSKLFTIIPEGVSIISDDIRENWISTPDKRFFLEFSSQEGSYFEILSQFIDALYGADMFRAGSYFASASLLLRNETLEYGQKWRTSRLEDQGFISPDEALKSLFSSKPPVPLVSKSSEKNILMDSYRNEEAAEQIGKLLASLAEEDGVFLLKQALSSEGILQLTGSQNTRIENLYDDEEFIEDAVNYLVKSTQKQLYALESRAEKNSENTLFIESVLLELSEIDDEKFMFVKQKLVYLSNQMSSAISAKSVGIDMSESSLLIVKGALNIGMEICLNSSDFTGASLNNQIEQGVHCLKQFGVEFIFQTGFQKIMSIQKALLNKLINLKCLSSENRKNAQKWLSSADFPYRNELQVSLSGFMKLIPLLHSEAFAQGPEGQIKVYLSQKYKPFETLSEIHTVNHFIDNLHLNLH